MSRLESFIRRLEAQRACLDRAAQLIADLPGSVFELGLGNGRTFDHLRQELPGRAIYVLERQVAAHPDCTPAAEFLILGDFRDTLPAACRRFAGSAALVHADIGSGNDEADHGLATALAPAIAALLREGGIAASDQPLPAPTLRELPLPPGVTPGRYRLYRKS